MSAVEEIETAMEALTDMRSGGSPGPWSVAHAENGTVIEWAAPDADACRFVAVLSDEDGEDFNADPGGPDCDAYLIVTLHCTIDAQLAILNQALKYERSSIGTGSAEEFHRTALTLARAINGTTP